MAQAIAFIDTIAVEVGVNEAIMLSNIHHWVMSNKAAGRNCYDGKYWTYDTVNSYTAKYPFWTIQNVRTILKHLEKGGYIESGCYNKLKFDRTKWYTLTEKGLSLFNNAFVSSNNSQLLNITNEVVNSNNTIPHTNTNTNTNNIGGKAPRGTKKDFVPPTKEDILAYIAEKVEAGKTEYKNVDVNTFFDYYNEADWHMSNGRKIKSWKQCLITWASREWNKKQEQPKKEEVKRPVYADEIFTEEEMQIW